MDLSLAFFLLFCSLCLFIFVFRFLSVEVSQRPNSDRASLKPFEAPPIAALLPSRDSCAMIDCEDGRFGDGGTTDVRRSRSTRPEARPTSSGVVAYALPEEDEVVAAEGTARQRATDAAGPLLTRVTAASDMLAYGPLPLIWNRGDRETGRRKTGE